MVTMMSSTELKEPTSPLRLLSSDGVTDTSTDAVYDIGVTTSAEDVALTTATPLDTSLSDSAYPLSSEPSDTSDEQGAMTSSTAQPEQTIYLYGTLIHECYIV